MIAPPKIWWKPLGRYERRWLLIAFVWCLFLTAMMPLWFYLGRQNVPVTTYRVTPQEFNARVMEFTEQYQVDTLNGIPVVEPPAGGDAYIQARQWQWYPVLKLKKGETYKLHLSSLDVQHGFSIQPLNMNFMVLPGYDYVLTLTPTTSGEYSIVCNEFCGIGHHVMIGKILVSE
ncbi:cytochrome c oxidase subunit II [Ardenticatena maritima]|uniref:Cytochrome aa3 subunit 2 n=1 Tax=Ardenticatena maritima TaxID=872965 RepID=A0A0M8K779_9CHLR|nr:cytochrome c oxidase subunit II [Ardenticatena maritima]KPL87675.1 cytochrome C oxidase subunit II [Ardenticatena maritima]GAP62152.1 cytochrome c oxidase subunit II [Ardenticatena maritima]